MEDDAVIRNFNPKLSIETISHFDLLYLGWHCFEYVNDRAVGRNLTIERRYNQTGVHHMENARYFNVGGFHSVVINETAYNKLLNLPMVEPLDSLVNKNKELFERYIFIPKLVEDPSGWSVCDGRMVNRL